MAYRWGSQFTDPGRELAGRATTDCISDPLVRALSRARRRYHAAVAREDRPAAVWYEAQYYGLERQRRVYLLRQAAGKGVG